MANKRFRACLTGMLAVLLLLGLFPVTAFGTEKTVSYFYIDSSGAPAYFLEGENFSPQGYKGIVGYSDGTSEQLSADMLTYRVETPLREDTTVTFSCTLTEQTQNVPVKVLRLDSLQYDGMYKTDYYGGLDTFDPAGLSFSAVFKGTVGGNTVTESAAIAFSGLTMSPSSVATLSSKDKNVFFSYAIGAHTVTVPVPVNVRAVQSLTVRNVPAGPFYEGLPLVYDAETQVLVEALYEGDATPKAIANPNIADLDKPVRPNVNSEAIYTVSLDGKTQSFTVPVIPVAEISASSDKPFRDIYLHKDNTFDIADIRVEAAYTDGSVKDVTDDTVFSAPEANVPFLAGDTVTAEFAGRRVALDSILAVHSAVIEAATHPAKLSYMEGEYYETAGFNALVRYDDGTIYAPKTGELTLTVGSPLQVSDAYAVYSWKGLSYRQPISVIPTKNVTLRIVTPPEKLSYKTNEPLSLKGLAVSVQRDGDPAPTVLSSGMYTTIPAENTPITDDITEIIIRYSLSDTVYYDITQPIQVTPKIATGIAQNTPPTKISYYEGQTFNPDGLTLSLVYSDQTVTIITEGFEYPTAPLLLQRESEELQPVTVTVTYGGMRCTIPDITVRSRRIDRMVILSQPEKKEYLPGENFDPTGMKVGLFFADDPNIPVVLENNQYSLSVTGALNGGTTEVIVSFRDATVSCPIYVENGPEISTDEPPVTTDPSVTEDPISTSGSITEDPTPVSSQYTSETAFVPGTTTPETTSNSGKKPSGGGNGLLVLWIVIIVVILGGLVALIIYYKRNFT